MPEIISLSNNSEYKGKIYIHFIADKFSNKKPDFIQKRGELWWFLQYNSVLDIEKNIIYQCQREPKILSITLRYVSRIVLVSRYGNDMGISSAAYPQKEGTAIRLILGREKRINLPRGFLSTGARCSAE